MRKATLRTAALAVCLGLTTWLGCTSDPRQTMDACGLPEPCDPAEYHTSPTCYEEAAGSCISAALKGGDPLHFTVSLSDISEIRFDAYAAGNGTAVLVTSQCDLDGNCGEFVIEKCTIVADPICGPPDAWCTDFEPLDGPECP